MIGTLFNEALYRPLLNVLVFLYQLTGDLGVSIIILTVLIKVLLFPLTKKQFDSQAKIKKLQPKIKELKEKYGNNKEKMSQEMMALYKKEKINPASGCLPLLVKLPVLIALYQVFMPGKALIIDGDKLLVVKEMLYSFPYLQAVGEINHFFLGLVDLTQKSVLIALISSALQAVQSKISLGGMKKKKKKEDSDKQPEFQEIMGTQMVYLMPVVTFIFGISFPAGLPLYWATSTIITIAQQKLIERNVSSKKDRV